jgi:hypothetical protein
MNGKARNVEPASLSELMNPILPIQVRKTGGVLDDDERHELGKVHNPIGSKKSISSTTTKLLLDDSDFGCDRNYN